MSGGELEMLKNQISLLTSQYQQQMQLQNPQAMPGTLAGHMRHPHDAPNQPVGKYDGTKYFIILISSETAVYVSQ